MAALALVCGPARAEATTCLPSGDAKLIEEADVVFEGVAQDGPTQHGYLLSPATFRVTRYLKGQGPALERVETAFRPPPGGGPAPALVGDITPRPGETWTIQGRRHGDGTIQAGPCWGSHRGPAPAPRRGPPGIVPNVGMGGVRLRSRAIAVLQLLGLPSSARRSPLHRPRTLWETEWREWTYRGDGLAVTFAADGRVRNLSTISPRLRTPTGVGVGSSERRLRRRIPGLRCRAASAPRRACVLRRPGRRQPVTEFRLRGGRVLRVTMGRRARGGDPPRGQAQASSASSSSGSVAGRRQAKRSHT